MSIRQREYPGRGARTRSGIAGVTAVLVSVLLLLGGAVLYVYFAPSPVRIARYSLSGPHCGIVDLHIWDSESRHTYTRIGPDGKLVLTIRESRPTPVILYERSTGRLGERHTRISGRRFHRWGPFIVVER